MISVLIRLFIIKKSNKFVACTAAPQGFRFRGNTLGVGLVGATGGGAPRTPENFRKFKKFIRKLQNGIILAY